MTKKLAKPGGKVSLIVAGGGLVILAAYGIIAYLLPAGPTEAELLAFNQIVAQARQPHVRDEKTPGWERVDGDAAALYLEAAGDAACSAKNKELAAELSAYGLNDTEMSPALGAALAKCGPAFAKIRQASRARNVLNPMGTWSAWAENQRSNAQQPDMSLGQLNHVSSKMVADALQRRDWSSLFAVARMGQDLQRSGNMINGAIGNAIVERALLRLRYALVRGDIAQEDRPGVLAELRYLAASDPSMADFWHTESAEMVCHAWKEHGATVLPGCRATLGARNNLNKALAAASRSQAYGALWESRMAYRDVQDKGWPARAAWWKASAEVPGQGSDVRDVSPWAKYDGLIVHKQHLLAQLRVALGDEGVVDPYTLQPFQVEKKDGGMTITSQALGDKLLLAYSEADWVLTLALPAPAPAPTPEAAPEKAPEQAP